MPTDPDTGRHPARPRPDGIETDAADWCALATLTGRAMHPAMRLRLHNALTAPRQIHYD